MVATFFHFSHHVIFWSIGYPVNKTNWIFYGTLIFDSSCNFVFFRFNRQGKPVHTSNANYLHTSAPIAAQAQAYLEQNVRAWINPKYHSQVGDAISTT